MDNKEMVILAGKSGSGASVTPASVASAIHGMSDEQAAQALADLGGGKPPCIVTITDDGGYVADKTYAEITAAHTAGLTVLFVVDLWSIRAVSDEVVYTGGMIYAYLAMEDYLAGNVPLLSVVSISSANVVSVTNKRLAEAENIVTVSGSTPTITPTANTIYKCGELSSLTVSNPPEIGAYSIVFTSGSTATTTTIPATILGLEDFVPEANTIYEINVLDNRALVAGWPVSAAE